MVLKDLSNVDLEVLYNMTEMYSERIGRIIKLNQHKINGIEYKNASNVYNDIDKKRNIILNEIIKRIMSVKDEKFLENN